MKKIILALVAMVLAMSFIGCSMKDVATGYVEENNLGGKQTTICYSVFDNKPCEDMKEYRFGILASIFPDFVLELLGIESQVCVGFFEEEKKVDGMICYTHDFIKDSEK